MGCEAGRCKTRKKLIIDTDILYKEKTYYRHRHSYMNGDRKILKPIKITSRPPERGTN